MNRVLLVANIAISNDNSNGRTMMNFLKRFDPDCVAQFYINGTIDESICNHHFQVTDKDALIAFRTLGRQKRQFQNRTGINGKVQSGTRSVEDDSSGKMIRSCRNRLLRDIVWRSLFWWSEDLDCFINDFNPDAVILQAGDSPFMYYITQKIAKKRNIPIIMYNSEGYVLKDVLYASAKKSSIWHFTFKRMLCSEYKRIMKKVAYCIYSTEYLEESYQKKFPHPGKSIALYTASSMKHLTDKSGRPFKVVYCGNLGVGRVQPLAEIADTLKDVDSSASLDIYGKFQNNYDKELLCSRNNVHYHGTVPYEEIPDVMSEANMVLHCENGERLENLKFAFSTKIADCLASGRPFLVYAKEDYPFVRYLKKNDAAHIAKDKHELKELLSQCEVDFAFANSKCLHGTELANRNHSGEKNALKFYVIVEAVCSAY